MSKEAIDMLNQIAAELGVFPKRRKTGFTWWRVPKNWKRTKYAFGYTPWKTRFEGQEGYFAVKYRILKGQTFKLVKAVRFGKRKVAKARSLKWYKEYYGNS